MSNITTSEGRKSGSMHEERKYEGLEASITFLLT